MPEQQHGRPSQSEIDQAWASLRATRSVDRSEDLQTGMAALKETRSAELIKVSVELNSVLEWFAQRHRLDEIQFVSKMLSLPEVVQALAEVSVTDPFASIADLTYLHGVQLDGEIARLLIIGGAYRKFQGTAKQGKDLALKFTNGIIAERYDDFEIYQSSAAWSPWFNPVCWSISFFIFDRKTFQFWILVFTDWD